MGRGKLVVDPKACVYLDDLGGQSENQRAKIGMTTIKVLNCGRKPSPSFEAATGAGAPLAKACVYLDDLGVNPKPAREMGMTWRKKCGFPSGNCSLRTRKRCRLFEKSRFARVNSINMQPA